MNVTRFVYACCLAEEIVQERGDAISQSIRVEVVLKWVVTVLGI
jgi:hypothetical protein